VQILRDAEVVERAACERAIRAKESNGRPRPPLRNNTKGARNRHYAEEGHQAKESQTGDRNRE
jgi:hypothetical protein